MNGAPFSVKTNTLEGISSTLLHSLFQSNPTYHPLLPRQQSSRPASITDGAQDKHKGQCEVIAFPLRSPGVLAGHFLLQNNSPRSPHNDNVNILYVPYNNHSENTQQGESKDNVC